MRLDREEREAIMNAIGTVINEHLAKFQVRISALEARIDSKADAAQLATIRAELETKIAVAQINGRRQ